MWDAGNTVALVVAGLSVAGNVLVTRWTLSHQQTTAAADRAERQADRGAEADEVRRARWVEAKRDAYLRFASDMSVLSSAVNQMYFRLSTFNQEDWDASLAEGPIPDGIEWDPETALLQIRLLGPTEVYDAASLCWGGLRGAMNSLEGIGRHFSDDMDHTARQRELSSLDEEVGDMRAAHTAMLNAMNTDLRA